MQKSHSEKKEKKYILIIEDEQVFVDILCTELAKEGYEVDSARDGEEGIKKITERPPDLVLLDIVMPHRDGFSVLREMKSDEKLKHVPVIVLSNSGDVVELSHAKKLGARVVLVKADFGPSQLIEKVNKFFESSEQERRNEFSGEGQFVSPDKTNGADKYKRARNVLITEDESVLSDLIKMKLEKEHFTVAVATTGSETFSQVDEHKPDIILLDLVLPDMHGFEVLRRLTGDPKTSSIPVVVFSNEGQQDNISKALEMGARDYIVKAERTPQEIVSRIREILGDKR